MTDISESSPALVAGQTDLEDVEEALKDVIDPELGVNIVDLGLLYGMRYGEDGALLLDMTLTTAACPLQDVIEEQVENSLGPIVDEWRINWVWMPPWGPERITDDGRDQMRALGFNI
ncbi:metal-sulfur cluster assembly factor [Arthrobacter sp. Sr24]